MSKKIKLKIQSHWDERWCKIETERDTFGKTYHFSDYGRLKSVDKETEKERLLKGSNTVQGFLQINLRFRGEDRPFRKGFYVHKLIANEWVKKESEDQTFAIHFDRNKKNNYYKNLKWMSLQEMTDFQTEAGLFLTKNRKRNANYKMNSSTIKLIRKKLKEGKTKKKIIAKQFGISDTQIKAIMKGDAWAWVED